MNSENKVEIPQAQLEFAAPAVRLQSKRRHHGDAAKEEDDVPAVNDGTGWCA